MVWIYLAESADLPLRLENGLSQSHIAKSNPIAKASFCRGCKKGICPMHQFGTIYESSLEMFYSMPGSYPTLSTSFTEVSRAKRSVLQVLKRAWKESEALFFSKYHDSSTRSSLPSYSLKTCQTLGQKEQNEYAKNWPKEGMIVDGVVYPLVMWERPIKEKGGFYWPTPQASDAKRGDSPATRRRNSPCLSARLNMIAGTKGGKTNPLWLEWLMGYPIGWTELKPLETQ